jgi:Flp pilus assembly protein TadG
MRRKAEAGQALVLGAVGLIALLGFAGLAVDMGMLRYEKRLQQTAADAAAIAGASNLPAAYGGPGSTAVTIAAQDASAANGFTDSSGNTGCPNAVGCVTVTVNNPPLSGPHTGNNAYVEALVTAVHPTYFMRALGANQEAVTARAVATQTDSGPGDACLYSLGAPSASIEGVNLTGSAILNAPNCGIVDNGNFNTKGSDIIVNAGTFGVSGGWNSSGPGGTVTCTSQSAGCPSSPMAAATDPLAGLASPCTQGYPCTVCPLGSNCTVSDPAINISGGSACGTGCTFDGTTYTISPGTYSSISIGGAGSNPNVVFQPGIYIIDGALSCSVGACFNETGNATITGNGVMFYFLNNSTVNITGTPILNLTAPSPSNCPTCPTQYDGILMYQAPCPPGALSSTCGKSPPYDVNLWKNYMLTGDQGPTLGGNSTGTNYSGALYFPSDQITFYGNNGDTINVAMVVSYSIALSGNPTVNLLGPGAMPAGVDLIKVATLVE